MSERQSAKQLLIRAGRIFDVPGNPLGALSPLPHGHRGFASGGEWMRLALCTLRQQFPQQPLRPSTANLQLLGFVKYTLSWALRRSPACCLESCAGAATHRIARRGRILHRRSTDGFLFPGSAGWLRPAVSRERSLDARHAGGTLGRDARGSSLVAVTMLLGGFAGRGFSALLVHGMPGGLHLVRRPSGLSDRGGVNQRS